METKAFVYEGKIDKSLDQWIRRNKTIHPPTHQPININIL